MTFFMSSFAFIRLDPFSQIQILLLPFSRRRFLSRLCIYAELAEYFRRWLRDRPRPCPTPWWTAFTPPLVRLSDKGACPSRISPRPEGGASRFQQSYIFPFIRFAFNDFFQLCARRGEAHNWTFKFFGEGRGDISFRSHLPPPQRTSSLATDGKCELGAPLFVSQNIIGWKECCVAFSSVWRTGTLGSG